MKATPFPRWAELPAKLAVIAAAYYVVGRLGLLLAIPPGYATAVWPASGIALLLGRTEDRNTRPRTRRRF